MSFIERPKRWLSKFSRSVEPVEHDLILFDPEHNSSNFCAMQFALAKVVKKARSLDHVQVDQLAREAIRGGRAVVFRGDEQRIQMLVDHGNNFLDQRQHQLTSKYGLIEFLSKPVAQDDVLGVIPTRIGPVMS